MTRESSRPYILLEEFLEDPDMLKPPVAIVPKLVWENRVTMLAAREKGGKSTLAGAAAAAVSNGKEFLGDKTLPGNVLIISLEEHPQEFVQRLVLFGADPKRVAIVQGGGENLVAQIWKAAEQFKPALIVWDTLGAFARHYSKKDLEPNDAQGWTSVMLEIVDIARAHGASLLLHHANKSDGKYRDSTAIGANVDVIIEMYGERDEPRTLKTIARFPTDEVRIKMDVGCFKIVETEKDFENRVLKFIKDHPKCSFRDLTEGVSGRTTDVAKIRDRLLKTNVIRNVGGASNHAYMASLPA